jgi:hypothetical protein
MPLHFREAKQAPKIPTKKTFTNHNTKKFRKNLFSLESTSVSRHLVQRAKQAPKIQTNKNFANRNCKKKAKFLPGFEQKAY